VVITAGIARKPGMSRDDLLNTNYKIVKECSLPYTGRGSVQRIITDLGVLDVTPHGLRLVELAPDVSNQELRDKTEPPVLGLS